MNDLLALGIAFFFGCVGLGVGGYIGEKRGWWK